MKIRSARGMFWMVWFVILFALFLMVVLANASTARAHDKRHAVTPQEKSWFDGLKSGKGPCCSDTDGSAVADVDWESRGGRYRVRLNGVWIDVPPDAVLTVPNLYGKTMVWPVSVLGSVSIRCFIAGVMM